MMGESRQMNPVFLAGHRLGRLALLDIKHLDSLVISRRNYIVALVVEIQRRDVVGHIGLGGFERLSNIIVSQGC